VELLGIGKPLGKMTADADDRAFVDSVDVQGNAVGLLDVEGL
jgi:hypothetical protein